jgi:hypothetical protein
VLIVFVFYEAACVSKKREKKVSNKKRNSDLLTRTHTWSDIEYETNESYKTVLVSGIQKKHKSMQTKST